MYVLVGGWPGSGKSTLSVALASSLDVPLLAKDEVKEALASGLGTPTSVEESQRLGRAAVHVLLHVAARCPAAVLDSTWFDYTRPLLADLPGPFVELRTVVPVSVARSRYLARAASRHPGHLDSARSAEELWAEPVAPLGVGPLLEVDTTSTVDIAAVAANVRRLTRASRRS